MKFTATLNNSYPKNGTWIHVYGINLPEGQSVADFHKLLSKPQSKTILDNGQPRFNSLSDSEIPTASVIEVWINKKGEMSNLTEIQKSQKETQAFNKVARLSGISRAELAGQALAMLMGQPAPKAEPTPVATETAPVEELDSIM
jgi:hypothetical protein